MEKLTYNVPEAAKVLGISRSLAYELVKRGEIPALRIGSKRVVIPKAALEKYLGAN